VRKGCLHCGQPFFAFSTAPKFLFLPAMKAIRKWVIPDLHGCVKTLRALIENHLQPSKSDKIFFLGDYIDRSYNPKGVLDYLMQLESEGYNIFPLLGNHEAYLTMAYEAEKKRKRKFFFWKEKNQVEEQWLLHGGKNTLDSFGVKKVREIPEKYVSWLENLKYFYEEDNYIIVHAGLNLHRSDPFEDTHAMLWSGSFRPDPAKINNKVIIHGHVPVSIGYLKKVLNDPDSKVIPLDNGCYLTNREGMGNLVALDLATRELILQPCID
jgi:serine/threonine protein phosphatase 1